MKAVASLPEGLAPPAGFYPSLSVGRQPRPLQHTMEEMLMVGQETDEVTAGLMLDLAAAYTRDGFQVADLSEALRAQPEQLSGLARMATRIETSMGCLLTLAACQFAEDEALVRVPLEIRRDLGVVGKLRSEVCELALEALQATPASRRTAA